MKGKGEGGGKDREMRRLGWWRGGKESRREMQSSVKEERKGKQRESKIRKKRGGVRREKRGEYSNPSKGIDPKK